MFTVLPPAPPSCVFLFCNTEQLIFSQHHFPIVRMLWGCKVKPLPSTAASTCLVSLMLSILPLARIFLNCVISVDPLHACYPGYVLGGLIKLLNIIY